jgi:hypothetical protein
MFPKSQVGEQNVKAKLTASDVREIRRSATPQTALASQYGVSPYTIWDIRSRKTWKHIESDDAPASLSLQGEEWRPCCPGHEASNIGRIRPENVVGYLPQRPRRTAFNRFGYEYVVLSKNGRQRRSLVHVLVAAAFLGPKPRGFQVNHINGVKADNRLGNLEYVTPKGNKQHAVMLGLTAAGERNGNARLTAEQVARIREATPRLMSAKSLAETFGVSKSTIDRIRQGVAWRHDVPRST